MRASRALNLLIALVVAVACVAPVKGFRFSAWKGRVVKRSSASLQSQGLLIIDGLSAKGVSTSATRLLFKVSEADDVDVEDDEELDFGQNDGNGAGGKNGFLKKLSRGVVPLAASLGFVVTPSPAIAVRVAGAAVGGMAGVLARRVLVSRIDAANKIDSDGRDDDFDGSDGPSTASVDAALRLFNAQGPPALASLDLPKLEAIARKANVASEDLAEFFTFVFAELVFQAVGQEDGNADLTELNDLIEFAERVALTQSEVGDGFTIAAIRIGRELERDARGFYVEEFSASTLLRASRIFFLADKMLGSTAAAGAGAGAGASEGYYGRRLYASLSYFTTESFQEVVTEACRSLYERCVRSVVSSPGAFTAEEVATLKDFLTTSNAGVSSFRPVSMQAFVAEALQAQLDAALRDPTQLGQDQVVVASAETEGQSEEQELANAEARTRHAMQVKLDGYEGLQQVSQSVSVCTLILFFSLSLSLSLSLSFFLYFRVHALMTNFT